jgi:hypothetical protein
MTSTTAHTTHVTDAIGPEPTQTPELAEGGTSTRPGALAALVAAGAVALYQQRRTGTLRRIAYPCPGTPARETAEYLADRVDDGASVAALAVETGLSRATVRRSLAALDLAHEIEAGDHDDVVEPDLTAVVFAATDEEDES